MLTDKQADQLTQLLAAEAHVEVEATWGVYQRMIDAYRAPDRAQGRRLMQAVIELVNQNVPTTLMEIITLGRTLTKRADEGLPYLD
jgi:hypothetical protein